MQVERSIGITHRFYEGSIQQEVSFFGLNYMQLLESEVGERQKSPNKLNRNTAYTSYSGSFGSEGKVQIKRKNKMK